MRFLIGLTACALVVAAPVHANDPTPQSSAEARAAVSRLLMVVGAPEQPFYVQQARFGAPIHPTYVAGADPVSAVVGNIIGHMIVSQLAQSDKSVPAQGTQALVAFFEAHTLMDLIKPGLTGAFDTLSVRPSIRPVNSTKPEGELRKALMNDPSFDQAVAITPTVQLDDDLLSLKTVYAFSGWRPDAGAWPRNPGTVGQVNIFFDYANPMLAGSSADKANWNTADAAALQAAFDESGRILAALLMRVLRQPEATSKGLFVIATTSSLEKVRGYRQEDIGAWAVIVDDNNNYHVLKPKKLFVLKQEA